MPGEIKSSVTAFRQATGLSRRTSVSRHCRVSEWKVKCARDGSKDVLGKRAAAEEKESVTEHP